MRSLISALFFMLALSACDNELNLISRDFSVSLKSIDGGAAAVGKAVNCTFSVNGLDPNNGDQLLTMFDIEGGNGVIIVDNSEYSPGESSTIATFKTPVLGVTFNSCVCRPI